MTVAHPKFAYEKGLHQLGNGAYAWLQLDGGWGWSNSGLIVDDDQALVVDTLFDVPLTRDMLAAYADASKAAKNINMVVNTHHNGDHCNGNCCCPDAKIIAHRATAEHMALEPPTLVQGFLDMAPEMGELGKYVTSCFGPSISIRLIRKSPTHCLTKTPPFMLAAKKCICCMSVGAHARRYAGTRARRPHGLYRRHIVHRRPSDLWEGPVQNWIKACDRILDMDVETIVPGHGPITTKAGVEEVRHYLATMRHEARLRYEAGMSYKEAAFDIALGVFDDWGDRERIVVNCATMFREFGAPEEPEIAELFAGMAEYAHARPQDKSA